MPAAQLNHVLQSIRQALGPFNAEDLTDGQLLKRFAATQDEDAFAALIRRHGPMVLGLCRRTLHDAHEAEDAFQAAFLVMVRKAKSLDQCGSVGGWLYTVAYHIAVRVRANNARRQARESQVESMSSIARAELSPEPIAPELRPILDEELNRLPEKYRSALVLCYLESRTHEEAAQLLGCPIGTVSSRLARGRNLLRSRLTRRGLTLSAGALATALTPETFAAAVPVALFDRTLHTGLLIAGGTAVTEGAVPTSVASLIEGTLTNSDSKGRPFFVMDQPQLQKLQKARSTDEAQQLEDLIKHYYGKMRQIDVSNCPADFRSVFTEYLEANEHHDRLLYGQLPPGQEMQRLAVEMPAAAEKCLQVQIKLDALKDKYSVTWNRSKVRKG